MRNWGNMSTTAHGTPQSRWRCEENLFEGTGAFSSTVRSRPGPPLARAPGLQPCLRQEVPIAKPGGKPAAALQQGMARADTRKEQGAKSRSSREWGPELPMSSSWWRYSKHIQELTQELEGQLCFALPEFTLYPTQIDSKRKACLLRSKLWPGLAH